MNRKRFSFPKKPLEYQPGNSKGETENQKALADSGVREISTREMEYISGGAGGEQVIPPEWFMKDE